MNHAHAAASFLVVACFLTAGAAQADERENAQLLVPPATSSAAPEPAPTATPPTTVALAPSSRGRETTLFGLPKNEGPVDRIVRGVVAGTLLGIGTYGFASKNISPAVSGTLMGVAAIPAATAATGYCPIYQVFGLDYTF
jgi:hypothetical protein